MTTQAIAEDVRRYQQFIDGQWVDAADGATFTRRSPADGRPVAMFPDSAIEDAERAIQAARRAFDDGPWPTSRAFDRAAILRRMAALLREREPEIALSISRELGRPLLESGDEALRAADVFDQYAARAMDLRGDSVTQQTPSGVGLVVHEPVGVVAIITPWNFPLLLLSWKIGPAIAAGCTMVVKPSHLTPGVAAILAEIASEAGVPDGVFNVIFSERENGAVVGQHLASSAAVDKVTFTGSTESGKAVMRAAATNVKRVSLELGGKSPNVVFADASLDDAVPASFHGIFRNTGQACAAGSRLLLAREVHDEFVERLVTLAREMKVGDPTLPETAMGPVVSEQQLARVMSYVERGRQEANLVAGGDRLTQAPYDCGYYVTPTIFDDVDNRASIAQEEIFGPVLAVITFDTVEEAVRIANDTMYGLSASLWTKDLDTAFKAAKGIRAGRVFVNAFSSAGLANMPFGGFKQSGLGREMGPHGIDEYLETKSIHIKIG